MYAHNVVRVNVQIRYGILELRTPEWIKFYNSIQMYALYNGSQISCGI